MKFSASISVGIAFLVACLVAAGVLIAKKPFRDSSSQDSGDSPSKSTDEWCEATAAAADNDPNATVYDYIVVGSGPGGGVVASRLAMAGFRTLLLDAGPDLLTETTPETQLQVATPLFHSLTTNNPEIEWAFRVTNTDDAPDRDQVLYPRSAGVGGCLQHHAMISLLAQDKFFDDLATLTGDSAFNSTTMRGRFQSLVEKNQYGLDEATATILGHGTDGYIAISLIDQSLLLDPNDFQLQLLLGVLTAGFPSIDDVNGLDPTDGFSSNMDKEGFHPVPNAIDKQAGSTRSSVYGLIQKALLTTSGKLTVKSNSFVTKLLLRKGEYDGYDSSPSTSGKPTAYGVEVQQGNGLYSAATQPSNPIGDRKQYFARKEVVVSGGAFNTPQLLMLSGIGPKEHLEGHSIPVYADVPGVGQNLQDKMEVAINFNLKEDWGFRTIEGCTLPPSGPEDPCFAQYLVNGTGLYSSAGAVSGITLKSDPSLEVPDVYVLVSPVEFRGYFDGWVPLSLANPRALSLIPLILVGNRGQVTLTSDDPFKQAHVDFQGYNDDDVTRMAGVVNFLRDFAQSSFGEVIDQETSPGPEVSEEALPDFVRATAWGHHACCTAKMGTDDDPMAVLDSRFRVRAVNNLRVVDHSSFPENFGFFPSLSIMMIAEKAAEDMIFDNVEIDLGC